MTQPTGLTKDVGYEIGVSRTVSAPVAAVWELMTSPDGLALWLGELPGDGRLPTGHKAPYTTSDGTIGEVRSIRPLDRVRLTWQPAGAHETTVQFTVMPSGQRTSLRFHQERLADAAERERQRDHWRAVTAKVANALGDTG